MPEQELFTIESLGVLYQDVQMKQVFPDSKYFVDCIPLTPAAAILSSYLQEKDQPGFQLRKFVEANFILPAPIESGYTSGNKNIIQHLNDVWDVLTRQPQQAAAGTLIPLPYPYVVPGGRFREVYYWDSYFTMLGLQVSKRTALMESMIKNFSFLLDTVGFIPNANRTYYLGRSQPPFFSMMVALLAEEKGEAVLTTYRSQLEKEYAFWMKGETKLGADCNAQGRVVLLPDGSVLNRYWDDNDTPRLEAFIEDCELAEKAGGDTAVLFRHIRAAAESGWDFSSRWFKDGKNMETIQTTHLVPVDLNCLLLHTEKVLLKIYTLAGDEELVRLFSNKISRRTKAIQLYCYHIDLGFYVDYNFVSGTQNNLLTLAAAYPLFFGIAGETAAAGVARTLEARFLQAGGLLTTLSPAGQQWDAPNGWAPLQWMAFKGLQNYGYRQLANEIKKRWTSVNELVYANTGKMMEKYNVADTSTGAGGGEYPNQDGFGWTNGVYLKLQQTE